MSKPDLDTLEGMVLVDGEPVFAEPWEAQAFALCLSLHQGGVFTWTEWADALSAEIHSGTHKPYYRPYYRHWLTALEALLDQKGLTSDDAITKRESQWHQAAARTPHGEPIEL
ncbi:MAG: nitrile hydratase accessory protein [Pseudomonadota bacterium]